MKIWKIKLVFFIYSAIFSFAAANEISPVFALTGGVAITSNLGSSTEFPIGYSQYDYNASNDTEVGGVFGAFIGAQLEMVSEWEAQIGLAYYQTTSLDAQGELQSGVDPSTSTPFDYQYDITSHQLLIEGKLLREWKERFHPYISAGLGVSFNEAENYDINFPENLLFSPFYSDKTTTAFSYNVGLGVDYDIVDDLRLGLGYRFTDLGQVELGQGYIDPINSVPISETLEQSHLYTQEILLQLTYVM